MSRNRLFQFLAFWLGLLNAVPAMAQNRFEFGPYGGGSFFSQAFFRTSTPNPDTSVGYSFVNGGVLGVRARENLAEHFGLEQSFTFLGNNNAQFPGALLGTRLRQFYFNGNLIGYDNESRVRPYFSGGVGVSMFRPTDDAKQQAAPLRAPIDSSNEFHYNVGGGLKFNLTEHFGLDFSLRDFIHKTPTFDWPSVTERDWIHNLQVQGGLLFMFGSFAPPIVHTFNAGNAIQAGNTTLCPGETTTLRIPASDSIPTAKLTYRWTVKGQEVGTGPEYTFTAPGTPGAYETAVRVFYDTAGMTKRELKAVKKNPGVPVERTLNITVNEYKAPTVRANVDRTTVQRGERVRLTADSVGSACSGALSYRWTTDKGRLTGDANQPSAELDTSGLSFSETTQERQCQPIMVTVEVTDQKGGRATDRKEIQVCYQAPPPPPPAPKAIQLSDINFGHNSARVNNCAKRILANELYSQMTDSRYRDYDVLLIGHYEGSERAAIRGRGRSAPASSLDRERVLNAAAFLSGRGDTCKDIELSRVKVAWVGTQQNSEFKSTFCDASTKEKRVDTVSSADEKAKLRRVEIWLVPRGAALPQGISAAQEIPQDEIIKKGCPK
ncbi:MAG: outer membrane beta-barrel protein [Acidobacteria bacterium]|nr:outer membrane beta-barrel protein [Acidobacteriota bacterium]MCI0719034.1 outer membrane beta-barrel protein [Acidobacteriota bacterium]